jgi:branched-chain amino acid transport system ATP-binding protein
MDLNLKYRLGAGRIVKKRDKIYGGLAYNVRHVELFEQELALKNEKKLLAFELESKKRLLPLEIDATPRSSVNSELVSQNMDRFSEKQSLPRRAVEQTALRIAKKQSEDAADVYRKAKLAQLDKKRADYEAQLLSKYPATTEDTVAEDAVERYQSAQEDEKRKFALLQDKLNKEKEAAIDKVRKRYDAKSAVMQSKLDAANNKLQEQYQGNVSKLNEGMIMTIKNIKMYFSGIKAVDDLSFDIKEGEIFGLIGPNGAGKTTLFNCITQFYKATDGEIYYRDRFDNVIDLRDYQSHDVAKTGIVRTFQNLALIPFATVLDNLMIGAHIYYDSGLFHQFLYTKKLKYEDKANRAMAMDILERLDLAQYKDAFPPSLSYGILKKVELARTMMIKPRLIILDEPAAGLNDSETEDLAEIIRKIRDDFNCTIFLVEHDMNLVMNVCDTVCAISFGKMLAIGTPEQIQEDPLVQQAYLGEEESA